MRGRERAGEKTRWKGRVDEVGGRKERDEGKVDEEGGRETLVKWRGTELHHHILMSYSKGGSSREKEQKINK